MPKTLLQLPTTRAVSIWQPWAHCIIYCGKDIENRSWKTNIRGEILIHSSKNQQFFHQDREEIQQTFGVAVPDKAGMSFGAIIGYVELIDCTYSELGDGRWGMPDSWHWHLRDMRSLDKPIPYRGAPGLL